MDQLRDLLYEKRVKLAEAERRAGMSAKYLSKLLSGAVEMKLVHLYDVLDAVKVTPRDFFARMAGEQPAAAVERRLAAVEALLADGSALPLEERVAGAIGEGEDAARKPPKRSGGR